MKKYILSIILIYTLIKHNNSNNITNSNTSTTKDTENNPLDSIKEHIVNSLVFAHGILNEESQEHLKQRIRSIKAQEEMQLRIQAMREINRARNTRKQTDYKEVINQEYINFVSEAYNITSKAALAAFDALTEQPKMTVICPIYNGEQHLYRNLYMLQKQTLKQIQIIYIDDYSSDNSRTILKELADLDKRITLIFNDHNMGIFASKIKAFGYIKANYTSLFDMDDVYVRADALEKMYNDTLKYNSDYMDYYSLKGINGKVQDIQNYYPIYLNYSLNTYENQILGSHIIFWLRVISQKVAKKMIERL